jgi:hypothetical protein
MIAFPLASPSAAQSDKLVIHLTQVDDRVVAKAIARRRGETLNGAVVPRECPGVDLADRTA